MSRIVGIANRYCHSSACVRWRRQVLRVPEFATCTNCSFGSTGNSSANREHTLAIYTDGSCINNRNVDSSTPAGWAVVVTQPGNEDPVEELYGPVITPALARVPPTITAAGMTATLTADQKCCLDLLRFHAVDSHKLAIMLRAVTQRRNDLDKEMGGSRTPLSEFNSPSTDFSRLYIGADVGSNNTGELSAITEALLWLKIFLASSPVHRSVDIRVDSEYAMKSVSGIYDGAKNRNLILYARTTLEDIKANYMTNITFTHVKAHSGDHWNNRADHLAKLGGMHTHTPRFQFLH